MCVAVTVSLVTRPRSSRVFMLRCYHVLLLLLQLHSERSRRVDIKARVSSSTDGGQPRGGEGRPRGKWGSTKTAGRPRGRGQPFYTLITVDTVNYM